jgi:cyanate permease
MKRGYGKGWLVILYSFLAYFTATSVGSAMNAASGTLAELRGWNPAFLFSLISLGSLANIAADALFGRLAMKRSVKRLSVLCIIIWGASTFLLGATTQLWVFACCLIIANGISNGLGYQLSPVIIAKWFPTRKGVVMGLVTIGIPLCAGLATNMYLWGYGYLGSVGGFLPFIAVAVLSLLVLLAFISDDPADKGFEPDNGVKLEVKADAKINKESIWTTSKLLKTPQVWIHGITLGTQMLFASGLMVQLFPRLLEIGYNPQQAGMMMIASGLFACVGSYICGVIDSKVGARKAACTSYVFWCNCNVCQSIGNRHRRMGFSCLYRHGGWRRGELARFPVYRRIWRQFCERVWRHTTDNTDRRRNRTGVLCDCRGNDGKL